MANQTDLDSIMRLSMTNEDHIPDLFESGDYVPPLIADLAKKLRGPKASKLARLNIEMYRTGSAYRLERLMNFLYKEPPEVFWPVFNSYYSECDDTWDEHGKLLRLLRRKIADVDPSEFMENEQRKFFSQLPEEVVVYRGCSNGWRRSGLSWTLDRDIAAGFAIATPNRGLPGKSIKHRPVVYMSRIPKTAIFTVFTGRGEEEVLLDPTTFIIRRPCMKTDELFQWHEAAAARADTG